MHSLGGMSRAMDATGDAVSAFVLEYTQDSRINLTQWADWEIEAAAAELPEEEEEDVTIDEVRLSQS